jgi:hypothetical protein
MQAWRQGLVGVREDPESRTINEDFIPSAFHNFQ